MPHVVAAGTGIGQLDFFKTALCRRCNKFSVWFEGRLIHPRAMDAPNPNSDLSDDVKRDYLEAAAILPQSPRGAAALLRLAVQKLCRELGESGKNVNDDIAALVRKGLSAKIQQALDTVRVVGDNAVHPGQIDLRDDEATARQLFGLVNLVADVLISQPKHVEALYNSVVPENARTAITKRDEPA